MHTVKLIAVTQPRISNETIRSLMSPNDLIAYCARVSNPSNQENFDTSEKLLKYCIEKEHWSIFEMINVVMEINTSRTIARQILRHRSFSFQEFSQRYADPTQMEFLTSEARLQDTKNRQNSIETEDNSLRRTWLAYQNEALHQAIVSYKWAIDNGIAKEVARDILPEGLTPSRMYMNGTLRSWLHYCKLRKGNGTQKEHRLIAEQAWDILKKEFKFLENL